MAFSYTAPASRTRLSASSEAPVLLILPGSYTQYTALYACLIMVTVDAAMALRTVLAAGTSVTLVSMMALFVIAVARGYLLSGLLDAVPPLDQGTEEEARMQAKERLVCGLAGLALLPAPLMYLITDHR